MHSDVTPPAGDAGARSRGAGGDDRLAAALAERLRELPRELTPPCDFHELQARAAARRRPVAASDRLGSWLGSLGRQPAAAAALALALVVLVALIVPGLRPHQTHPSHSSLAATVRPRDGEHSLRRVQQMPALEVSDGQLEAADTDADPLVHVSTRLAEEELEDRIASLDDALNTAQLTSEPERQVRALRVHRQALVSSLVQVRYAERASAGLP